MMGVPKLRHKVEASESTEAHWYEKHFLKPSQKDTTELAHAQPMEKNNGAAQHNKELDDQVRHAAVPEHHQPSPGKPTGDAQRTQDADHLTNLTMTAKWVQRKMLTDNDRMRQRERLSMMP